MSDTSQNHDTYKAAVKKQSFDGQYTAHSVIVTLAVALALYNSMEMVLLISTTFKRFKGLYFWSLTLCTYGVASYAIGMMLMYFDLTTLWVANVILDQGWMFMITCQSLVLYSRLGLILDNVKILRAIKWMIIVNCVLLGTMTCTFDFGTTYTGLRGFARGYFYIEHIQVTVYTIQELILSGLYVWKTVKFLDVLEGAKTRKIIWQLLVINVIIIAMDIVLIVLQFKHLQLYQESIKVFFYSVKLKLELNILSKLVDLVHDNSNSRAMTLEVIDATAVNGATHSDIQKEVSRDSRRLTWFGGNDEKNLSKHPEMAQTVETRQSSSTSPSASTSGSAAAALHDTTHAPDQDPDHIARTFSQQSRYGSRVSGRETDMMYAEFMQDMK